MRIFRAILCSAAVLCAVAACGPDTTAPESGWTRTYGGTLSYQASTVRVTADGGYLVAGTVRPSSGFIDQDIWLLRINSDGSIVWQMAYGGPDFDGWQSLALEPTADGGFVVAGSTASFRGGEMDAWVLKLDGNGNVVWQWTLGGTGPNWANAVQPTMDGGYIVAGATSFPGGYGRTWVLKLDASGIVAWQRQYDNGSPAVSVKQSADGGYVVVASNSLDYSRTASDFWLLKLDASGNVIWEKTYARIADDSQSFLSDRPTELHLMTDGGFLVAGITSPPGEPVGWSGWILRLDASGDVLWSKSYPGSIASVQPIGDGHFVVAGAVQSPTDVYKNNPWVMKMDSGGNVVWQKTIPDEGGRGEFSAVQPTADGGYVVVGSTDLNEDGVTSARVLKLDSDGASAVCANLALYDRPPSNVGVITGSTPTIAVATDATPAISLAVPNASTAMILQSCGAASN